MASICLGLNELISFNFQTSLISAKTNWAWFNIKMSSYWYRKSHCGDKTVVRSSYLHNGISYAGKITSFYWIRALVADSLVDLIQLWLAGIYNIMKILEAHWAMPCQWVPVFLPYREAVLGTYRTKYKLQCGTIIIWSIFSQILTIDIP